MPKVIRILHARPKLVLSVVLGIGAAFALPSDWRLVTRSLVGWDVGLCLYLAIVYWIISRSAVSHIRQHATSEDDGRLAILALTVGASLASLAAIIALLGGSHGKSNSETLQLIFAVATIFLSWTLIHTIFGVHYAHEFYSEHPRATGLNFPGNEKPDYWDFVYFSFVVGMTFQVSDVAITSRSIRKAVLAHAIISFLFNVALLALTVNIAATGILGPPL
jgi:uncharacterized membrane protein